MRRGATSSEGQDWISRNYGKLLSFTLRYLRPVVILIAIGVAFAAWMVGRTLQSELLPTEDQSVVMVFYEGPQYVSFADLRRNADEIDAILQKIPEGLTNINLIGTPAPNYYEGLGILTLTPGE